jgi:hypothetical protein
MNQDDQFAGGRRRFLLTIVAAPAATAICTEAMAAQSALPHVAPTDATAVSLAYVENAKTVNPAANPTFKPGAHCGNCLYLQGKAPDAWRPCVLFPNKLVSISGWCRVWMQKA